MNKKIKYTDEPMQTGRIVKDFLPRPEDLVFRKQRVLTLRLDEPTLDELKEVANRKGLGMSTLVRMWVKERLAENVSSQTP
ncbi:MAG: BrnA antitoxin family protein [Deltaproteobacteria bacterium]|nr:BrnA antitoxin family protein [Deltaproteobacteria bacterium]